MCPSFSTPPNWPPTAPSRRRRTTWPSAATRCTPPTAPASWSGPRATFADGDPFLAGGGAVDLVDLDEVVWTEPPEREEAGSPNVVGAVALEAALATLEHHRLGHASAPTKRPWPGGSGPGSPPSTASASSGPALDTETLAIGTFTVDGLPHAARGRPAQAEWGIGVRHGCFCAHPYLIRLLGLSDGRDRGLPRRGARRRPHARSRAPSAPAAGSPPRRPTSTPSWPPWPSWPPTPPPAGPRPCPTTRIPAPGTSGPSPTGPGGRVHERDSSMSCARG